MIAMSSDQESPKQVLLSDYRPPAYLVPAIRLQVDIRAAETVVTSTLSLKRGTAMSGEALRLDGRNLELRSIAVNGRLLRETEFVLSRESLSIPDIGESAELSIVTAIKPRDNKSGLGLYESKGILCTQMEAEGFRCLTYFPDRPDVMTAYEVTIEADKKQYPVLLCNGNKTSQRVLAGGRHEATFKDPFLKPCYLFALVAGDLGVIEDRFVTKSGRSILLQIYCSHGNEERCRFAMESLQKAMRWDEDVYGLEYDLDTYVVVVVDDFNAGAMENKGLNIFNAMYVLADPSSARDEDYIEIEAVIAHEYFHNYTGNRVTLRNWFQLTLKEGLTVLREQDFSADMNSAAVERIKNVRIVRERQFLEDAGPNAHPIRPESYIEIDNFYTSTVYRKGAEVIGMLKTLLGEGVFNRAVREYLRRFDGQAVRTEDFLQVMQDVSGEDLSQFALWYSQAGTPVVKVREVFDAASGRYRLEFSQSSPLIQGQAQVKPFVIPIRIGLLDAAGRDVKLDAVPGLKFSERGSYVDLRAESAAVECRGLKERPVPSLLRNFSAPVKIEFDYSDDDLAFLLAHDSDPFNRYEAGQRLGLRCLQQAYSAIKQGRDPQVSTTVSEALARLLVDEKFDAALRAQALMMPSLLSLCMSLETPDFDAAFAARRFFLQTLTSRNREVFWGSYRDISKRLGGIYRRDSNSMGWRSLKNVCLGYLVSEEKSEAVAAAFEQYRSADNMTDSYAALRCLALGDGPERGQALSHFYDRWRADSVVMDMWVNAQVAVPTGDAIEVVKLLERNPAIDSKNPNKISSLYGTFAGNLPQFHRLSGEGYTFFADRILQVDAFNPNVAAGLAKSFHWFMRLDPVRRSAMEQALSRLISTPHISKGLFEILHHTLYQATTGGPPRS